MAQPVLVSVPLADRPPRPIAAPGNYKNPFRSLPTSPAGLCSSCSIHQSIPGSSCTTRSKWSLCLTLLVLIGGGVALGVIYGTTGSVPPGTLTEVECDVCLTIVPILQPLLGSPDALTLSLPICETIAMSEILCRHRRRLTQLCNGLITEV